MSEILVYVEGPSDEIGLRKLFEEVIECAKQKGDKLDFYPFGNKKLLLNHGPLKALNILRNKSDSFVFLVPDIYPPNVAFDHEDLITLRDGLQEKFKDEAKRKGIKYDSRLSSRFFVHCFKYDFESLILASEKALLKMLNKSTFLQKWKCPVEDQNHHQPPKRIVEFLFEDSKMKYKDTYHAPLILEETDYIDLIQRCPQCFKPFVEDIFRILKMELP